MKMNWSKLALVLGCLTTVVSPTFIPFSRASAASGEFSGTWKITRDQTINGIVSAADGAATYSLNLNSHANKFVGNYIGINNDSIFQGETYFDPTRTGKVITFQQYSKAYYVVFSGRWISTNKYQGTWFDNAGKSGDFLLQK